MTKPILVELIKRLEKATGPDRELDWAISQICGRTMPVEVALGHDDGCWVRWIGSTLIAAGRNPITGGDRYLPRYTASIDAALTLVPEEALWKVAYQVYVGDLYKPLPKDAPKTVFNAGVGVGPVPARWSEGQSPTSGAIALCIAALRARLGKDGEK